MKWYSLVYEGDVHPSDEKKLIPAEDFSKLVEAHEIVEMAQKDAERLAKESKEKCKTLEAKAKEKGRQEGLESFNEMIFSIDEQLKAMRHSLQQMVLPIALKAAKRIVGKQLEIFPETIVDIVMQAIKPISESHQVTIYVNKEDKEYLDAEKPKLKEILQQAEVLTIQERGDVEKGGCIIKTESGMLNATIENQWRALERAFETYKEKS